MVAVDGEGVARSHRGMGLVSDIFNERVLGDLPGDVAIGHTRYSTAGTSVLANAQPMLARYREGPLALAHNGNLTNAVQLRSDLVAKGSLFQSSSDSEVLVHLIARSEAREPEDQLLDALERVDGAYSLLITVGRTLYAIVDPRGFRPLVLGRLGRGWVVASETCALDITRSEEHTSELQSQSNLVCRLLLEKKKNKQFSSTSAPRLYAHVMDNN